MASANGLGSVSESKDSTQSDPPQLNLLIIYAIFLNGNRFSHVFDS